MFMFILLNSRIMTPQEVIEVHTSEGLRRVIQNFPEFSAGIFEELQKQGRLHEVIPPEPQIAELVRELQPQTSTTIDPLDPTITTQPPIHLSQAAQQTLKHFPIDFTPTVAKAIVDITTTTTRVIEDSQSFDELMSALKTQSRVLVQMHPTAFQELENILGDFDTDDLELSDILEFLNPVSPIIKGTLKYIGFNKANFIAKITQLINQVDPEELGTILQSLMDEIEGTQKEHMDIASILATLQFIFDMNDMEMVDLLAPILSMARFSPDKTDILRFINSLDLDLHAKQRALALIG